jgi:hypothetical protein
MANLPMEVAGQAGGDHGILVPAFRGAALDSILRVARNSTGAELSVSETWRFATDRAPWPSSL